MRMLTIDCARLVVGCVQMRTNNAIAIRGRQTTRLRHVNILKDVRATLRSMMTEAIESLDIPTFG